MTTLPHPATLQGMDLPALESLVAELGEKPFRAKQIFEWVYTHGATSIDAMTNLSKEFREALSGRFKVSPLELMEVQGQPGATRKAVFRTADDRYVEAVAMREEGDERTSICISSQVGCAMGCTFCMTGYGGFQRNLTAAEIVAQVLGLRSRVLGEDEPIHHMVFMGMGEPMHNLEAVIPALQLITDPDGMRISRRRVTVSTVGHVEGLRRFAATDLGVYLAVSINATTNAARDEIMPINRRWPLEELVAALEAFPLEARSRITIEYVLLKGVNDTEDDARRLVKLLRGLRMKVNLIMFNPDPHLPFEQVSEATLNAFAAVLKASHYTVTVRWSKGREIDAACGQLAAHYFRKQG